MTPRPFLALAAASLVAVAHAQEAQPDAAPRAERPGASAENAALENEMTPELHASVERGLAWLAEQQNPDGSWDSGRWRGNVGIVSLACLAFMSDGHLPGRGKYGENVKRGLEFILARVTDTGFVASETPTHGPMYEHGFAALFLGEVYGMTAGGPDTALAARVRDALVRSIRVIVQSQNEEGGWRYNPVPYDADLSVTICQIMAMRSARNAGIDIPREPIDKAVEYVRRAQNPDGGFMYQLTGGRSLWPRSAAGVASLYYAGIYEDDAIDRGLAYIKENALPGVARASDSHFFYGHYYAAQAMYLAGGEHWAVWWPAVREDMLQRQSSNPDEGFWVDTSNGPVYATAMALIVLQMPKRYLPIFQK
ncbi:MAG: prenyltransferase/squalene oxidase repeat-containing protein [Phycisphaerales bacterium]